MHAARVAALFSVAKPTYLIAVVLGGIVLIALWGPYPALWLLAWFVALVAVTLFRLALHWQFARAADAQGAPRRWENRFALGALASGAVWALAAAVFFPEEDPARQLAIVFVVGGVIVGAAGLYAPSLKAVYAFGSLPLLAVTAQLLAQPSSTYRLLALAVAVFGVAVARMAHQLRRNVAETAGATLRNEELLARANASETQLRDAIESFPEGITIWSSEDRLVMCNLAYARLYGSGRGPQELVGTPFRQIAEAAYETESTPEYQGRREDWVAQRVALHQHGSGEANQYQSRDGRWRRGSTMRMRGGGYVGVVSDITDLKRAQEAYLKVLAEEHLVLGTLPVGVAFSDISERHAAESALKRSEQMYRNLVETSSELIWSLDREGRWTYLNAAGARRIYGREAGEMIGRHCVEVAARELQERERAVLAKVLAGEPVFNHETRHLRRDGSYVDLAFNAIALRDPAGQIVGATGAARDITEHKRANAALHESVAKLRLAVDAADLYYWEWEPASDRLHWGRDPGMLPGSAEGERRKWSDYAQIVYPEDRERYLALGRAVAQHPEPFEIEYRVVARDGRIVWFSARGLPVLDGSGKPARMIGVSQDITERKGREEAVRFLAYHDSLTGLPNRRLLDDRLKQALYQAQRRDKKVAAMLIDLDNFKQVNDTAGHRAGDAVLREVAQRFAGCVRKADTLARHGGDEFVIVISDLMMETDCEIVAGKILRALADAFRVDGRSYGLGASIGISIFPTDATDAEALLRNADAAMYRAKQVGRNRYSFYGH